jgi:ParB/RepB/Spo0J family partition protein
MAKSTGIAQFSTGRSDIHRVDPRILIIVPGFNMREESPELDAHIDMLAQSIAEVGVKKPIEVKLEDGKLLVREGHCRARASIVAIEKYGADLKTVPVISVDRYANDADMILNQVIGNSGKPFTTMEQAKIFKKLLDMGWIQSEIAKKVGMSNGRISQILDLLTMPAPVQAAVIAGTISASLAQQTVKAAETPAVAAVALQAAVDQAVAEGRKVKPADVAAVPTPNLKTVLKQCFEDSDIDCSQELIEQGIVSIDMPLENWEKVRKLLEL